MDAAITTTTIFNHAAPAPVEAATEGFVPVERDFRGLAFDLGLWLSGLESFLNVQNHSFEESRQRLVSRDWTKEFRLVHSTLLLCARLNLQLLEAVKAEETGAGSLPEESGLSAADLFALSQTLKNAVLMSEGLLRATPLKFGEWTAWANSLSVRLRENKAFASLIDSAEKTGEQFLPPAMDGLLIENNPPAHVEFDLKLILPRIGKILKWLSVINELIRGDKPLKPALLLFARVYELVQEMVNFINSRLMRFPNDEDPLYGAMDGASYVASIELRKVYRQELVGVTEIRPTPQVRARIEAAYGLLNDSFQQTLIGFAQLVKPEIEPHELFPVYQIKLEQSLVLRQDLWAIMEAVLTAEQNPDTYPMDILSQRLTDFTDTTMRYLLYKDWETFERFVEEVVRTKNKKDLVPILHRFGAYLETLFGQVNMRAVLAGYPFEYPRD